ncbi:MAG TPA: cystathionine beta-synthase [Acidimicrobiales bacterium]|nr:cystathionine beta-synthase [Acidimicrobiales bacterium]
MDVLVVVGNEAPPGKLADRAGHRVDLSDGEVTQELVDDLRARLPREVGVVGAPEPAATVASALHQAGLPVTLHTDAAVSVPGVAVVATTEDPAMDTADSVLDLIGNTPLVRLDRTAARLSCHLLAKMETQNPGGSVKDRPALAMVDAAEQAGLLQAGGTIVEPTSGNTGVGLALVAARRRYRCVFTMPDKISSEKIQLLRAYGAEVVVCPATVPPEHPDSYYSVAARLTREIPGAFQPDQYHNPANPAAHLASTGPEIWAQTNGRVTHFVAGIGTGGTISGVGRYLKSKRPDIQVIGADPEGSVYSGGGGRPYLVEGIGEDFWPNTYDPSVVDRVVTVSDRDSFLAARRLTREEGILAGGSCGTAVWAALEVGRDLPPEAVVVVLLPDSGRGYLSRIYNDEWMADYGFLTVGTRTVGEVLTAKRTPVPPLVHIHPQETVRAAISVLEEFGVSQLPVLQAEPPLAVAEVVGAVSDRHLLELAFADAGVLDTRVADVMEPPLPTIGTGDGVDRAVTRLQGAPAAVVLDGGHPVGILTRSDLLDHLSRAGKP